MRSTDPATVAFVRVHGGRPFHLVCLPGLVPDGPETYARQMRLLRAHGSLSIATYPAASFDLDAVIAAVRGEIRRAVAAGAIPVLVGLSVGGGIVLELLRRAREAGEELPLGGLILISPLTCTGDLSTMLSRLMSPIVSESARGDGRPDLAIERGRSLFKTLVSRATEGERHAAVRWLGPLGLLTPQGFAAWHERRLAARIQRTLDVLSPDGAVARVLALGSLRGLNGLVGPLCQAPTLILWGSKERQTLDMDGPGTGRLCRPDLACRVFPAVEVQWIYDRDGGEVPHASLLKHAAAFNPHLAHWLRRRAAVAAGGALRDGWRRFAALAMPRAASI